ncbi:hypothetical protein LOD99_14086 [Oopsacas minuta]|uniref:Uncharacterized protein n=1 Tax=Oopsacas minuta TaxID=111878 RepID=A0AAV7KGR8_9METZ|nr:hypothetical protein LOD99_14086 [Oopsacas minuta]
MAVYIPANGLEITELRRQINSYTTPELSNVHQSSIKDPLTGEPLINNRSMVPHANIVFFGPVGSGSIQRELSDHNPDQHKTLQWREYISNKASTVVFQDTRGDQAYSPHEQDLHRRELMGFYKNGALLEDFHVFNKEWWSQRFFWTRSIRSRPHCVVFVFDGSLDPFFSGETVRFFTDVFQDCLGYQYEPIVVVTCLDIIYKQAIENGRDFNEEVDRRKDAILTAFSKLNFNNARIHFVANFNQGSRHVHRLWDNRDEGFSHSEIEFVKLYKELLECANLFLSNNLSQESFTSCALL